MRLKKKIGNFRMTYRDSGIEITTGDQWKPMGIKKKQWGEFQILEEESNERKIKKRWKRT